MQTDSRSNIGAKIPMRVAAPRLDTVVGRLANHFEENRGHRDEGRLSGCSSSHACACSAINVKRGAELVRVTNREPGRECKFLGDVTGSQGNRFTGGFTSDADLETGARNDLKNKAFDIGGNVVYLMIQRMQDRRSLWAL
jgi:hypothetical protein